MDKSKKKIIVERIVILTVALVVLGLLVFFLSSVFVPFIKLEIAQDIEGAKELLIEKGWMGYATVSVVEALQMVVIFIPAEFIQLTSGMSYPWWLAILLCDAGVILGSSIIYLLVNIFKFDGDIFGKQKKIEKYAKRSKSRSTIILMLLLFIMPIIPFGAICYYGSNKKIPYWKYVLTCAFGVLPSIATSIIMGTAVKEFITNALPIWLLILIIIGAAAILFVLLAIVLHIFFFKQNDGTPDSVFYTWMRKLSTFILRFKYKFNVINGDEVKKLDGAFLLLANHHAWFDFCSVFQIDKEKNYSMVMNQYYFRIPVLGKMFTRAGYIGKKMFYPDMECIRKILKSRENNYPIVIFPEARLSTDGNSGAIAHSTGALAKRLDCPLVLVQIRNAYFGKPKWRKKAYRTRVDIEVMKVVSTDELAKMSNKEVDNLITQYTCFNEFDNKCLVYKQKNKAEGLENILYRCPHCGGMFTNVTIGNKMTCTHCGKEYLIKDNYQFDDEEIKNISEYYDSIKEFEKGNLDDINIDVNVDVKIFTDGKKKYETDKGIFHFDSSKVSYCSSNTGDTFEYPTKTLEGIAYSVNEEFEMYHENKLYYFYPNDVDRKICTRIALLYELLKERETNGTNQD